LGWIETSFPFLFLAPALSYFFGVGFFCIRGVNCVSGHGRGPLAGRGCVFRLIFSNFVSWAAPRFNSFDLANHFTARFFSFTILQKQTPPKKRGFLPPRSVF